MKNVAQIVVFAMARLENTVWKKRNTDHKHFLLLPCCFQKLHQGYMQYLKKETRDKSIYSPVKLLEFKTRLL